MLLTVGHGTLGRDELARLLTDAGVAEGARTGVASIVLPAPADTAEPRARDTLHGGEELRLELAGDLGARNAGLLVFAADRPAPELVPWADVARVDLDHDYSDDGQVQG